MVSCFFRVPIKLRIYRGQQRFLTALTTGLDSAVVDKLALRALCRRADGFAIGDRMLNSDHTYYLTNYVVIMIPTITVHAKHSMAIELGCFCDLILFQ